MGGPERPGNETSERVCIMCVYVRCVYVRCVCVRCVCVCEVCMCVCEVCVCVYYVCVYVRVHSHAARNVTLCIYPDLKDPNLVSLQTLCHIRLLC